jgi:hypothetical protein
MGTEEICLPHASPSHSPVIAHRLSSYAFASVRKPRTCVVQLHPRMHLSPASLVFHGSTHTRARARIGPSGTQQQYQLVIVNRALYDLLAWIRQNQAQTAVTRGVSCIETAAWMSMSKLGATRSEAARARWRLPGCGDCDGHPDDTASV